MVAVILSLYAVVFSVGSSVRLIEAEKVDYEVSTGSQVRLQKKTELEHFNLWTGLGQILFVPNRSGETITFELPITRQGLYSIAALVTKGPQYGRFQAELNGQAVPIRFSSTTIRNDKKGYRVIEQKTMVFDASQVGKLSGSDPLSDADRIQESIASDHVGQRIDLGEFPLPAGIARISLTAVEVRENHRLMGVDQWILKYLGEWIEGH